MKFKVSNKGWIVLSTAIVIGIVFSIYFLVYVKGKEKAIISNNFRVLQQVVKNIKSLETSYLNNAKIISKNKEGSIEVNRNLSEVNVQQLVEKDTQYKVLNAGIKYGNEGIFFLVDSTTNNDCCKIYFTNYDVFFNNELFQRKDVFDQIIIYKVILKGVVEKRKVLFSNDHLGILDSTFQNKKLRSAKDEITINDNVFVSFNQKINDDLNIYISGLKLKSTFEQQKRSVSPLLIFTLSISLILIIMVMPLLKLKIMSNDERLYIKDVLFTGVSVLIGPAVLLVFLYTLLIFFGKEKTNIENNLKFLSTEIEVNLQKELHRLVNQIDSLNTQFTNVIEKSDLVDKPFIIEPDTALIKIFGSEMQDSANYSKYDVRGYKVFKDVVLKNEIEFKHLKAAFWADDSARLLILLSAFNKPSYAQDLSHRKYLTNILENKPNYFKDLSDSVHEIAIESIKSVSDGSYEVGVGKSTSGAALPVMAISTKLSSVMGTVLEEGYGFCILNNEGKTMFHSDIRKNMNENFLEETNGIFTPSMVSKIDLIKHWDYEGKKQTIYFRPLKYLSDHYIATFADSEVQYGPYTTSMVSSFVLFLGYLILVLLVYLIMYFATLQNSKLKQTVYVFNFLRPYETERHFNKYKRLILLSIVVIIYLILSSIVNKSHFDFLIMDLIIVTTSLLIFSFYTLNSCHPDKKLTESVFNKYSNTGFKLLAIFIVVLLVYRIIHYLGEDHNIGEGYEGLIVLNSIAGLLLILFILLESFYDERGVKLEFLKRLEFSIDKVQSAYKLYLFLWGIIFSIIPINLFFQMTYSKETSISEKYRSLDLLTKIQNWEKANYSEFSDKFENEDIYDTVFLKSMKRDTIHWAIFGGLVNIESVKINSLTCSNPKDFGHNHYFNKIYHKIRPEYYDRTSLTSNFIEDCASDLSWTFTEKADSLEFLLKSDFYKEFPVNQIRKAKVYFYSARLPAIFLIFAVSLIILWIFLNFTLDKIYGFKYIKLAQRTAKIKSKRFIKRFINPDIISKTSSYNNIFIVSVNSSNTFPIRNNLKSTYKDLLLTLDFYDFQANAIENTGNASKEIFNVLGSKRFKKDWRRIEEYFSQSDEMVYILIEHFEYGYNDVGMNKLKLEVLKYLVDCEHFKVLISSEINAAKLLDYYEDSINKLENLLKTSSVADRKENQKKLDDLKIDFKKWQHLLGSFVTCIIPIKKFSNEKNSEYKKELAHGEYLEMIKKYLGKKMNADIPKDDMVLTVQQMSSPYYYSIWNSLSKDERYIVYDIAKDRFVNTINTDGILSLLNKGILVYDHSMRLMNDSFENFVLTKVNSNEALEMEMESRKKGTWDTAFAVILLLIISLVIFLSIGQQNFLNDINSFLTAIAALIGLLIRFSGFLSFGGNKGAGA